MMKQDLSVLSLKIGVATFLFSFSLLLCLVAFPSAQAFATTSSSASTTCADTALSTTISEADASRFARQLAVTMGAGKKALKSLAENPIRNAYGDIETTYCISGIYTFFKTLTSILDFDIVSAIVSIILAVLEDLLNQVCQLVMQAITNVLTMICLPLPDLSLGKFTLPGLDGVSCDGISLADYVSVDRAPALDLTGSSVPSDLMSVPLSVIAPSKTGTSLFGN